MADDAAIKGSVIEALEKVQDPKSGSGLLDAHMIEGVEVADGKVTVELHFQDDRPPKERWAVEDLVYEALEGGDGISEIIIDTKTKSGPMVKPQPSEPASDSGQTFPSHQTGGGVPPRQELEGVGTVIAVASGKGGVGKSTVAVNLALALSKMGVKVGLLDVDIYGPSLPTLLGISGQPKVSERKILPIESHGLKVMSLGFLMEDDMPVIWRGPIVTGIIRQFLQDVDWRGTDYLILDLPPGTGDAQLTLAQSAPLDGAIVVTTPSDLALLDAARGLQMFRTLNVDVLGIVENMSHFAWPGASAMRQAIDKAAGDGMDEKVAKKLRKVLDKHERTYVFGEKGGAREAKRLGLPLLGEIPLDVSVRLGGDTGKPIMVHDPDSPTAKAFFELAAKVAEIRPLKGSDKKSSKRKGLFSFKKS